MSSVASTHWLRVVVLWLCGVAAAMQFAKISFGFVALQAYYALTPVETGLLLSTVGVVGLLLGVTVGLFAQTIGYRRLLVVGLGAGALLAWVQSFMPAFSLFWITRVLEGASHLAVVVSAPTLMVANCAPRHRSIVMGLWSTFVGVAFALTAAVGVWIVLHVQLDGLLRWHAIAMAVMFGAALLPVPADTQTGAQRGPWPGLAALPAHHLAVYSNRATALPGVCFFFYTLLAVSLLTFVPQFGGPLGPWLAVVLPLVSIGGSFSAGFLAHHVTKPGLMLRLAFAGVALSGALLAACIHSGFGVAAAAVALLFLSGLAGGSAYALIPQLNEAPAMQARANGAVAQLGNLGATLGPPIFATLVARWGANGLALPIAVVALAGLGVAHLHLQRHAAR